MQYSNIQNLSNTENYNYNSFFIFTTKDLGLLQDCEIKDEEVKSHIKDLDEKCKVCIKYKKTKPQPVVDFPLAKTCNETMAMDLEEWPHDKNIWLLRIKGHATRYSVSYVVTSKDKELTVKKLKF